VREMSAILAARNFSVAYGEVPVVRAISLALGPGEIVALLGRNGMGKTTLLRGIVGLAPVRQGDLTINGEDMIGAAPETIARAGIGYVPAGRGIFGSLSVRENLVMCARSGGDDGRFEPQGEAGWTLERVLALFPRLAERMAHGGQNLSGGEQQMLAIGRALMTNPRVLLIDEATEGLAPLIARDIWRTLSDICRSGVAAVIVDRDVRQLAKIARRTVVLFKGEIVFDGAPDRLLGDQDLVQRYIGV
jgi:branched-chain amino acid transport system ATP-binding protein